MAVVCVTACPSNMTFVTGVTVSGCLAIPSQLASATMPPPRPEPIAPNPDEIPAPRIAAQVGETGLFEKSVNNKIKDTTNEKIAGVWHTAEPMSIFVVNRPLMAGCRAMPVQQDPAGYPAPTPAPMAPSPIDNPAPNKTGTVKTCAGNFVNSSIMAMTNAKMEEDSAMACPTSMALKISPENFGLRDMASLAHAAVCPSPIAAPMAPKPMAIPPPLNAATFTQV